MRALVDPFISARTCRAARSSQGVASGGTIHAKKINGLKPAINAQSCVGCIPQLGVRSLHVHTPR